MSEHMVVTLEIQISHWDEKDTKQTDVLRGQFPVDDAIEFGDLLDDLHEALETWIPGWGAEVASVAVAGGARGGKR